MTAPAGVKTRAPPQIPRKTPCRAQRSAGMSAEKGGALRALSRQGLQLCEVRVGRAADSRSNASVRSANVRDDFRIAAVAALGSAPRRDNVDVGLWEGARQLAYFERASFLRLYNSSL